MGETEKQSKKLNVCTLKYHVTKGNKHNQRDWMCSESQIHHEYFQFLEERVISKIDKITDKSGGSTIFKTT